MRTSPSRSAQWTSLAHANHLLLSGRGITLWLSTYIQYKHCTPSPFFLFLLANFPNKKASYGLHFMVGALRTVCVCVACQSDCSPLFCTCFGVNRQKDVKCEEGLLGGRQKNSGAKRRRMRTKNQPTHRTFRLSEEEEEEKDGCRRSRERKRTGTQFSNFSHIH